MAKFDGIFEIKGTLQGMSFYKSKDGMLIRKIGIANFNPATNLSIPQGATHASFSVAVSNVDFELENYGTTYSTKENFALVDGVLDLTLTPTEMPGGSGSTFFYFLIEFFQELNGVQYPLKNNSHNVLYLMEVV